MSEPYVPSDEELTALRRVIAYDEVFEDGSSPMRIAYMLRFAEAVLLIEVDPEFDSLEVRVGPRPELRPSEPEPMAVDLSDTPPWSQLLGRRLGWRWAMTNQNGYFDGLQLEFEQPGAPAVAVQWTAWGSELYYVLLDERRRS
ncbi:MAG: DUF6334 family protein [Sporichthyaceae bacterium]